MTLVATQRTRYIEDLAERIYSLPFPIRCTASSELEKGNAMLIAMIRDDSNDNGGRSARITETVGGFDYTLGSGFLSGQHWCG